MMQLHDFEKAVLDGDIGLVNDLIDRTEKTGDFDLLYEAAGLLVDYGYVGQADHIYEMLITYMPDEPQLKIDRANTLMELGDEDDALLLLSEVTPEQEEYVQALLALADYYQMIGMAEAALARLKRHLHDHRMSRSSVLHTLNCYSMLEGILKPQSIIPSLTMKAMTKSQEQRFRSGLPSRIVQGLHMRRRFLITRRC